MSKHDGAPLRNLLATAQPFGFGPIAKLVGMAALLDDVRVSFAGRGIALRYAQLNDSHFDAVDEFDLTDLDGARSLVDRCDGAISVMEPGLVFSCVREGRPVYFFDSLFAFWLCDRSLDELASAARTIASGSDAVARSAFGSLSVHESMIVSHLIATRSYAQSFPGVAERVADLSALGFDTIAPTGSMIDLREIDLLRGRVPATPRTLVVNLGGFVNPFLDYGARGSSVDIILRWVTRLAQRTTAFDEIIVCSGAFGEPSEERYGSVRIAVGLLPHRELLEVLAARPAYLMAPGLTSLHEALALGIAPMLLPDQHYGHLHNRRSLLGTRLAAQGASFSDLGLGIDLPDDDLKGTLAIAEVAEEIEADSQLFDVFARYMDDRLDAFLALTAQQRDDQVAELGALLCGVPIAEVMRSLQRGDPT